MKRRRRKNPEVDPMLLEIFTAASGMTASGQEPRKHHIVPRFYLERWAENGRVLVTDLDARESHIVAPAKALVEKDFYRVPAGTVAGSDSPVVWEAMLSKIEGMAAAVFTKVETQGPDSLSGKDYRMLVDYMGMQISRTRWHRYQARWTMSVGLYRQYELHRPGEIEAMMRRAGRDPTPEQVAAVEAEWNRLLEDPWRMKLPAAREMDLAQRAAIGLADLLADRQPCFYETEKPLITCDEPVISMWEFMGADHVQDGGYHGAPIVALPMGPHRIFALFRKDIPVRRRTDVPLDWRDTLDLNQVIAGNAFRHTVSQPSNLVAGKLRIPEAKDPAKYQRLGPTERGGELLRGRVMRRWSDEAEAPVRPVATWWPEFVPLPSGRPRTPVDWVGERQKWLNL